MCNGKSQPLLEVCRGSRLEGYEAAAAGGRTTTNAGQAARKPGSQEAKADYSLAQSCSQKPIDAGRLRRAPRLCTHAEQINLSIRRFPSLSAETHRRARRARRRERPASYALSVLLSAEKSRASDHPRRAPGTRRTLILRVSQPLQPLLARCLTLTYSRSLSLAQNVPAKPPFSVPFLATNDSSLRRHSFPASKRTRMLISQKHVRSAAGRAGRAPLWLKLRCLLPCVLSPGDGIPSTELARSSEPDRIRRCDRRGRASTHRSVTWSAPETRRPPASPPSSTRTPVEPRAERRAAARLSTC